MLRPILAALALISAAPCAAEIPRTGCEAAAELARIHDRYHAVVIDDPKLAARSAAQLLTALPGPLATALAARLAQGGTDVDAERLDRILVAAQSISRDIVMGRPAPMVARAPHRNNVAWLADIVRSTNCVARFPDVGDSEEEATGASLGSAGAFTSTVAQERNLWPLLSAAGIAALLAMLFVARKSRPYRIAEVQRLPRHFTTVAVDVSYETPARGPQGVRLTALDISAGGMKLAWENAPPLGTTLSVRLPQGQRGASVVWSNAWYAGIMFDQHLPEDELAPLISSV